jgi:arginyl-tRNA synthetase
MKTLIDILEKKVSAAMAAASAQENCPAIIKPCADTKFGDYQANGVMGLAKKLKTNPRKLAEQVVAALEIADLCEAPEIAGPGFINLRLKPEYVSERVMDIAQDPERLGIKRVESPQTVIVDFSSPNVAKHMHVGHLRSTIIGDCLCRLLEFEGHEVLRQNHVGDWGTQFGMLIAHLNDLRKNLDIPPMGDDTASRIHVQIYQDAYRLAKQRYDNDPQFAKESHEWVVRLQSGDKDAMGFWNIIVSASLSVCQTMYDRLDVKLQRKDVRAESFYNPMLSDVVRELEEQGLAEESDGAICMFPDGFKNKEGEPLPLIIQKSNGAYLYATTDLAALRYRVAELRANRIVYVTDSRQKLHFDMFFACARAAGWISENVALSHVMFGTVLGEDGAPIKTRSGENIQLKDLLDEAVERAQAVVEEKNPDLSEQEKQQVAQAVGIGAVKYADYSNNRTSDYVFSFDKMLAMEGNTAPYMQYAYARVKSIGRKAREKGVDVATELTGLKQLSLTEAPELDLAKHLLRYGEAIESAIADYRPNYLTSHLYELAQKFSSFYASCPVLDAAPEQRATRLMLCDLTARTIKHGLGELLGIDVVEQM